MKLKRMKTCTLVSVATQYVMYLHADWLFVSHDQVLRGGGLMMMHPVWPHPPKQRCGLYVMSSSQIM